MNKDLEIFNNFFRSNQHLLEQGDNNWPIERILYQLSYEHAQTSPLTKQAEKYYNNGRVDWVHFKQLNSKKALEINPNYKTLISHTSEVIGVHLMGNNQALSCSKDGTLILWDL